MENKLKETIMFYLYEITNIKEKLTWKAIRENLHKLLTCPILMRVNPAINHKFETKQEFQVCNLIKENMFWCFS